MFQGFTSQASARWKFIIGIQFSQIKHNLSPTAPCAASHGYPQLHTAACAGPSWQNLMAELLEDGREGIINSYILYF